MGNYHKLEVWQRAQDLSIRVHQLARDFPPTGAPGLRSQLLRSVASIGANIAEGAGQNSDVQFVRFLNIAIGSASECENHILLARGIGVVSATAADEIGEEVQRIRRMLFGLRRHLRHAHSHAPPATHDP